MSPAGAVAADDVEPFFAITRDLRAGTNARMRCYLCPYPASVNPTPPAACST